MFAISAEPPAEQYAELLQTRARERLANRIARANRETAARQHRPTHRRLFGRLRPGRPAIPATHS